MSMLEAKDLCVRYTAKTGTITAMDNVSLNIEEGEFVCLLGPSGCGKSTFLNIVAGFLKPTSGEIRLDGKVITKPGRERGVVFQEHALFPWLTIKENILFGLKIRSVSKQEQAEELDRYLDIMGLMQFKNSFPKELSGGMRQRTSIARALANKPRMLLMDEPFSALDEQTRRKLQDELIKIWGQEKVTVLFITHSIDEALILADKVVVMTPRPGKVHTIYNMRDYPRPRDETSPEMMKIKAEITEILKMKTEAEAS